MKLSELVEKIFDLNDTRLYIVQLEGQIRDYKEKEPTNFSLLGDRHKQSYEKAYSFYKNGLEKLEEALEKAKLQRDELEDLDI